MFDLKSVITEQKEFIAFFKLGFKEYRYWKNYAKVMEGKVCIK